MDDGSNYTVTTNYDALSRPAGVVYPMGLTVNTSYTAFGPSRHFDAILGKTIG